MSRPGEPRETRAGEPRETRAGSPGSGTRSGGGSRLRGAVDAVFAVLYPGAESGRDSAAARLEERAMRAAVVAGLGGIVVSLIVFRGAVPIWGPVSPGSVGLLLAGITAIAASLAEQLRPPGPRAEGATPLVRRIERVVNPIALALVHAGIVLMVLALVIAVLVSGFVGLEVDVFTSTVLVTLVCAATAYGITHSASSITASRLSGLLAVFMTGGVVIAMLTTTSAEWWRLHFSELGVGSGLSGIVFNATLIVGGLLLASLASLVAPALRRWSDRAAPSRTRNVPVVAWAFVIMGLCLVGVGLVPVNESLVIHNTFATGMAVVFAALLIGLRWLLDGFSRAFLAFSDLVLGVLITGAILFWPVGYSTLAAYELIAAGAIFAWLVLLLRHIDAAAPADG